MKIIPTQGVHEGRSSHATSKLFLGFSLSLLLVGVHGSVLAASPSIIDIAAGDAEQLMQEFASAWERGGSTTLRLAPSSTYHVGSLLPHVPQQSGKEGLVIHLQGRGAQLIFDRTDHYSSADFVGIFLYPGEQLKISQLDIRIENTSLRGFFDFRGDAVLEDVSITDSHLTGNAAASLIDVRGSLHAVNLTIAGNQVETTMSSVHHLISASAATSNIVLENATVADNWGIYRNTRQPIGLSDEYDERFSVKNSVINRCDRGKSINSLGGNLFLDPACGAGPDDRLVTDARFLTVGQHGGLVSTYAISPDSPAIGAGLTEDCAATDARGQVRHRRCDAGAYQFGIGSAEAALDRGGVNGSWYDVDGSGVLMVNRNNDRDTLLAWFGYDNQQHQVWIYTTVPFALSGESAIAYINDVAPSSPDSWPTPREAGTLGVSFSSCHQARVKFDSSAADLPSFELDLSRLTFTAQLGCVEAEAQEED